MIYTYGVCSYDNRQEPMLPSNLRCTLKGFVGVDAEFLTKLVAIVAGHLTSRHATLSFEKRLRDEPGLADSLDFFSVLNIS